jgi:hypothetical protein
MYDSNLVDRAIDWLRTLDADEPAPCQYGHADCSDRNRGLCSNEAAGVAVDLIGPFDGDGDPVDYFRRAEAEARRVVAEACYYDALESWHERYAEAGSSWVFGGGNPSDASLAASEGAGPKPRREDYGLPPEAPAPAPKPGPRFDPECDHSSPCICFYPAHALNPTSDCDACDRPRCDRNTCAVCGAEWRDCEHGNCPKGCDDDLPF